MLLEIILFFSISNSILRKYSFNSVEFTPFFPFVIINIINVFFDNVL